MSSDARDEYCAYREMKEEVQLEYKAHESHVVESLAHSSTEREEESVGPNTASACEWEGRDAGPSPATRSASQHTRASTGSDWHRAVSKSGDSRPPATAPCGFGPLAAGGHSPLSSVRSGSSGDTAATADEAGEECPEAATSPPQAVRRTAGVGEGWGQAGGFRGNEHEHTGSAWTFTGSRGHTVPGCGPPLEPDMEARITAALEARMRSVAAELRRDLQHELRAQCETLATRVGFEWGGRVRALEVDRAEQKASHTLLVEELTAWTVVVDKTNERLEHGPSPLTRQAAVPLIESIVQRRIARHAAAVDERLEQLGSVLDAVRDVLDAKKDDSREALEAGPLADFRRPSEGRAAAALQPAEAVLCVNEVVERRLETGAREAAAADETPRWVCAGDLRDEVAAALQPAEAALNRRLDEAVFCVNEHVERRLEAAAREAAAANETLRRVCAGDLHDEVAAALQPAEAALNRRLDEAVLCMNEHVERRLEARAREASEAAAADETLRRVCARDLRDEAAGALQPAAVVALNRRLDEAVICVNEHVECRLEAAAREAAAANETLRRVCAGDLRDEVEAALNRRLDEAVLCMNEHVERRLEAGVREAREAAAADETLRRVCARDLRDEAAGALQPAAVVALNRRLDEAVICVNEHVECRLEAAAREAAAANETLRRVCAGDLRDEVEAALNRRLDEAVLCMNEHVERRLEAGVREAREAAAADETLRRVCAGDLRDEEAGALQPAAVAALNRRLDEAVICMNEHVERRLEAGAREAREAAAAGETLRGDLHDEVAAALQPAEAALNRRLDEAVRCVNEHVERRLEAGAREAAAANETLRRVCAGDSRDATAAMRQALAESRAEADASLGCFCREHAAGWDQRFARFTAHQQERFDRHVLAGDEEASRRRIAERAKGSLQRMETTSLATGDRAPATQADLEAVCRELTSSVPTRIRDSLADAFGSLLDDSGQGCEGRWNVCGLLAAGVGRLVEARVSAWAAEKKSAADKAEGTLSGMRGVVADFETLLEKGRRDFEATAAKALEQKAAHSVRRLEAGVAAVHGSCQALRRDHEALQRDLAAHVARVAETGGMVGEGERRFSAAVAAANDSCAGIRRDCEAAVRDAATRVEQVVGEGETRFSAAVAAANDSCAALRRGMAADFETMLETGRSALGGEGTAGRLQTAVAAVDDQCGLLRREAGELRRGLAALRARTAQLDALSPALLQANGEFMTLSARVRAVEDRLAKAADDIDTGAAFPLIRERLESVESLVGVLKIEAAKHDALENSVQSHQADLSAWVEAFSQKWQAKLQSLPTKSLVDAISARLKRLEDAVMAKGRGNRPRPPPPPPPPPRLCT
ncbi:hypothetical protein DIPPA_35959 [Diplonema papillatum]|nr:hypothetical protein DIPPA_35959 [Diplonema papillatum]